MEQGRSKHRARMACAAPHARTMLDSAFLFAILLEAASLLAARGCWVSLASERLVEIKN